MNKFPSNFAHFMWYMFKAHALRIITIAGYSIACGYFVAQWPILIEQTKDGYSKLYLFIIAFMHFSFNNSKEFLLFPIYNSATYLLKLKNLDDFHNEELGKTKSGKAIARENRSYSTRYFMRYTINIFRNSSAVIASMILIYKLNKLCFLGIFGIFLIYTSVLIFIQHFYIKLRKQAWQFTEIAGTVVADNVSQSLLIRQELLDSNFADESLRNEYNAWHKYYHNSNIVYISLTTIAVSSLLCGLYFFNNYKSLLIIWNFINYLILFSHDFRTLVGMIVDLNIFFKPKAALQKQQIVSDNLEIQNVYMSIKNNQTIGPINFSSNANLITLTGPNGAGKTRLALAIAGMIPFDGKISSPNTLYINSEAAVLGSIEYSKGENIFAILEKAITHKANLIIIDEGLDLLSDANIEKFLGQFVASNKKLLVITHKKEIMELAQDNLVLSLEDINDEKLIRNL